MPLFNVEYLRNDTRYTHSFNRPLLERDMCPVHRELKVRLFRQFSPFGASSRCFLNFCYFLVLRRRYVECRRRRNVSMECNGMALSS